MNQQQQQQPLKTSSKWVNCNIPGASSKHLRVQRSCSFFKDRSATQKSESAVHLITDGPSPNASVFSQLLVPNQSISSSSTEKYPEQQQQRVASAAATNSCFLSPRSSSMSVIEDTYAQRDQAKILAAAESSLPFLRDSDVMKRHEKSLRDSQLLVLSNTAAFEHQKEYAQKLHE